MERIQHKFEYKSGKKTKIEVYDCASSRFSLYKKKVTSFDLEQMLKCPWTAIIQLHYNKIEEIDLTPLAQMKNLKEFQIDHNKLRAIDLTFLAQQPKLKELILHDNDIAEIDLSPLAGLQNLETVSLSGNNFTEIDLTPLSSCPNLKFVGLSKNPLRTVDLTPLLSCAKLKRIRLNPDQDYHFEPLTSDESMPEAFRRLEEDVDLRWETIQRARGMTSYGTRTCTLSTKDTVVKLTGERMYRIDLLLFAGMKNLEALNLSNNEFEEIDLSPLQSLKKLKVLDIQGNPLKKLDLTPIAYHESIESILVDDRVKVTAKIDRKDTREISTPVSELLKGGKERKKAAKEKEKQQKEMISTVQSILTNSENLIEQGRYDEAHQALSSALEKYGTIPHVLYLLGLVHEKRGLIEEATDYYFRSLGASDGKFLPAMIKYAELQSKVLGLKSDSEKKGEESEFLFQKTMDIDAWFGLLIVGLHY